MGGGWLMSLLKPHTAPKPASYSVVFGGLIDRLIFGVFYTGVVNPA